MKDIIKSFSLVFLMMAIFYSQASFAEKQASVERSMFTTGIIDREPVDQVLVLSVAAKTISFFTELRHFDGQTVTHKWIYKDKTASLVKFKVKGPRWRVYSSLDINPTQLGQWSVVVQDEKGRSIKANVFRLVDINSEQIILPKTQ